MGKWHGPAAAGALRKRLEYDADPLARIPHDGSWADGFIRDLYAEHGPALHAYVQQLGAGYHDAEEVVQETMVRAWRNARLLDPATGSIRGWLYTVARHILIDRLRIRTATPIGVEPRDAESAVSDHPGRGGARSHGPKSPSGPSSGHRMGVGRGYDPGPPGWRAAGPGVSPRTPAVPPRRAGSVPARSGAGGCRPPRSRSRPSSEPS